MEKRTKNAKIAEYDNVLFILKQEEDGVYEGKTIPPKKWAKTGNVELRTTPNTTNTVGSVEETRKRILGELDPDFKTYIPDQGMPDTVWELNDSQIDYIIQQAKAEERDRVLQIVSKDIMMQGEWGKLTPFQETVNTYLLNRIGEIEQALNQDTNQSVTKTDEQKVTAEFIKKAEQRIRAKMAKVGDGHEHGGHFNAGILTAIEVLKDTNQT